MNVIRKNMTIPKPLDNELQKYKHRINLSKVCTKAIQEKIEELKLQDIRSENLRDSIKKFCNSEEITETELKEYFETKKKAN